jgi:hypothetical protein
MPTVTQTRALLVLYVGNKVARAKQVIIGKVYGELLGVGYLRGNLHGKIRLVLAREHAVGHLIEDLRKLGSMILADCEDNGFSDLTANRIAKGIFKESLAEKLIRRIRQRNVSRTRAAYRLPHDPHPVSSLNETMKPCSESSSVVISVRASTTSD